MKKKFDLIKSSIFYNPLNALVVWSSTDQMGAWDELEGDLSCDVISGTVIYVFLDVAAVCGYAPGRHNSQSLDRYRAQFALVYEEINQKTKDATIAGSRNYVTAGD